jgi:hypothetical protein
MEPISASTLRAAQARLPKDHFVIWTGDYYNNRKNSLRSEALRLITEVAQAVPLAKLLERAARVNGPVGYHPDEVRSGLRRHQGAKPAVYLEVWRDSSGDYRAVTEIPCAGVRRARVPEDGIVLNRLGQLAAGIAPSTAKP